MITRFVQWLDTDHHAAALRDGGTDLARIDWVRCAPFLLLHVSALSIFLVGWSWTSVCAALGLYVVRMFGVSGFYHRYFAHRSFRTSRWAQFAFAVVGASAAQRGPLWWASIHREHHRASDTEADPHSPVHLGFLHAHVSWFMSSRFYETNYRRVHDFARFPELVWLNRFDNVVPCALALAIYLTGMALERGAPSLGVSGPQFLVWGFVVSTLMVFHATSSVNSFAHLYGSRRYETADRSRNNVWLALLVLGEGWHNNHHQYLSSSRAGLYWWEIDATYYGLKILSWLGLIWDLKRVPDSAYRRGPDDGGATCTHGR